jgi:hypothetical protein
VLFLYENLQRQTKTATKDAPTFRKQIGKTTYIVRVHFSETARETLQEKIERMIRDEVMAM